MGECDPRFSPAWRLAMAGALLIYGALLVWRVGAVAGAVDSSGYMNQARLLAAGKIRTPTRALASVAAQEVSAFAYVPVGFSPAEPGDPREMVAIYPLGLPLLIATAAAVVGWEAAAPVTMVGHALAGVVLVYALGRAVGLRRRWAVWGAAAVGVCPLYVFVMRQVLSDGPALVWTTAALLCAWRARSDVRWAWLAGAVLGVAVLVRPTNALAALPAAVVLGGDVRRWWRWLAGGGPLAVLLALYNAAVYGNAGRLGYGPIAEAFSLEWVAPTLRHYAVWAPVLTAGLGVAAPGALRASVGLGVWRWALATWIAALGGFYALYPFTHGAWWYLRFVLPVLPAVIVAGLATVQRWSEEQRQREERDGRAGDGRTWVLRSSAVLALGWLVTWSVPLRSWKTGADERRYVDVVRWAERELPSNAVIFGGQCTGALHYSTEFVTVHWAYATEQDVARLVKGAAREGRPVYAMLFPFEQEMITRRRVAGRWRAVAQVRPVSVWQLERSEADELADAGGLESRPVEPEKGDR